MHLLVESRRNSGRDWESANPTRLLTGDALGVGAALMMVVLTEWDRDANFLRAKKSAGSLRFLFLNEANPHDNLGGSVRPWTCNSSLPRRRCRTRKATRPIASYGG